MSAWMIVSSPANFERTVGLGFASQGMKTRHRKKALAMVPGDRIVFYVTGRCAFAAVGEVESHCFEERTRIWNTPSKPAEDYPWRVRLRRVICPAAEHWVPAADLRDRLIFVKKWPPAHWRLAFQGHVHAIADADAALVLKALQSHGSPGAPIYSQSQKGREHG